MSETMIPLTPEEQFAARAEKQAIQEANEYPTLATGEYTINGTGADAFSDQKVNIGTVEAPKFRRIVKLKGDAFQNGQRKGKHTLTVSPDVVRKGINSKQDAKFRFWATLVRILFPDVKKEEHDTISIGDLIARWKQYPVGMMIEQTFKEEVAGSNQPNWYVATTPEQVKEYREKGFSAINITRSVFPAR